jgi:ABC-type glycerol-3-phosphate transport system substrate-binding protein
MRLSPARRLRRAAATVTAAVTLAACGGAPSDSPAAPANDTSPCGGVTSPVTISYMEQYTDAESAEFDKLLSGFAAQCPDIHVQTIRDNDSSFYDKLTTQIIGGKAPDLVRADPPHAAQYLAAGWAAPLGTSAGNPDDYFKASLEAVTKDGQLYGVPIDVSALALLYRTDLFQAAGIAAPPKTWAEFIDDAKRLTHGDQFGVGLFGGWGAFEFYPWLWQAGGEVLSGDQKHAAFNSTQGAQALQLWVDLAQTEKVMPPGMATATEDDLKGPFVSGKLAMLTSGPWMLPSLNKSGIDGKWAVAPLPQDAQATTVLGGEDLLALSGGKHLDATRAFIRWLMTDDVQKQWASALGYVPVKQSLYRDPAFADPAIAGFQQILQQARSRPTVAAAAKVDTALGDAVQAALSGTKSAQQALNDAAATADRALGNG